MAPPFKVDPSGTIIYMPASAANPDILAVNSKDSNACATEVIVFALPPVGSKILFQIRSSKAGLFQFWHTVASGDTFPSVAKIFIDAVNNNSTLAADNLGAQPIVGTAQFGVSHTFDDTVVVSAAAWLPDGTQIPHDNGGVFILVPGNNNLDAGPVLGLSRAPDKWMPTAGSNVGQIQIAAPTTALPGQIAAQYATICGNIIDPDPAALAGELEIDTAETINGQVNIRKRLGITKGLYMSGEDGNSLQDMGQGSINCTALYVNGVKIA